MGISQAPSLEQFHNHVETIQNIIARVCRGAEDSVINKQQCKRLANMYEEINAFVKQLVVMVVDPAVHPASLSLIASLEELICLLEKGEILVLQYAGAHWFELLVTRGENQEAFKEIHLSLETYITTLHKDLLTTSQISTETVHLPSDFDFKEDANQDLEQMLAKLKMLEDNVPIAIKKLQGPQSVDKLPSNMQIARAQIKLGKTIGRGSYGDVLEATWLGCKLVAKVIRSTGDTTKLREEIQILSKLSHPHVVQFVGYCEVKRTSMILMEAMHGDLRTLIENQARDVSRPDGPIEVKISDFGVSQRLQLSRDKHGDVSFNSCSTSMYSRSAFSGTVGTTGWMAPEVLHHIQMRENKAQRRTRLEGVTNRLVSNNVAANGGDGVTMFANEEPTYTAKADVYSFGMTCCEILTRNSPFNELQRLEIHDKVMAGESPELPVDIDTQLAELIRMCWDTNSEKRPTFAQICTRMQALKLPTFQIQPEIVSPKKKEKRQKKRKRGANKTLMPPMSK
ncbi:hypothetical protein BDL97_19G088900 [Sphagnum fallax]|nr:hypothetical protein BDL97_19G088900 [Sphagnum fallax]